MKSSANSFQGNESTVHKATRVKEVRFSAESQSRETERRKIKITEESTKEATALRVAALC